MHTHRFSTARQPTLCPFVEGLAVNDWPSGLFTFLKYGTQAALHFSRAGDVAPAALKFP